MAEQLKQYIELTYRVIDQTERRVSHGEIVPASEKIVSIFGHKRRLFCQETGN
jgi:hypothetical protein